MPEEMLHELLIWYQKLLNDEAKSSLMKAAGSAGLADSFVQDEGSEPAVQENGRLRYDPPCSATSMAYRARLPATEIRKVSPD